MKEAQVYTSEFFQLIHPRSNLSAMAVIPLVLELYRPGSVVDVGCGLGGWLAAFQACGVEDILGIDGDYVDRKMLDRKVRNVATSGKLNEGSFLKVTAAVYVEMDLSHRRVEHNPPACPLHTQAEIRIITLIVKG